MRIKNVDTVRGFMFARSEVSLKGVVKRRNQGNYALKVKKQTDVSVRCSLWPTLLFMLGPYKLFQ